MRREGFPRSRLVDAVEVDWFDDSSNGDCRVPQSWKLLCRVGQRWRQVQGASQFDTKSDSYKRVTFQLIDPEGPRLEARLQPNSSGGILEWKAVEQIGCPGPFQPETKERPLTSG